VDWIGLTQDRYRWTALLNVVRHIRVPYNAGKLSSGFAVGGLSWSSEFHRVSYLVSVSVHTEERYINTVLRACYVIEDVTPSMTGK
jgi:hypothetical protein